MNHKTDTSRIVSLPNEYLNNLKAHTILLHTLTPARFHVNTYKNTTVCNMSGSSNLTMQSQQPISIYNQSKRVTGINQTVTYKSTVDLW